jgi:hypothetical protein
MLATNIEVYQFKNMLMDMAQLGAAMALKTASPQSDEMSQREAWETFGRQRIALWDKLGYISAKQRYGSSANAKINYSRSELMALDIAERQCGIFNIKKQDNAHDHAK